MRILAISGSIRAQSTNRSLLLAMKTLASDSIDFQIYEGLASLPFFNPDLDGEGAIPPPEVQKFRGEIEKAQAIVISTPEYAHGIPGVLKNALDWLVSSQEFLGKSIALIYASAGEASFAQQSLVEILKTMSAQIVEDATVNILGAKSKIAPDGHIKDAAIAKQLGSALKALTEI